MQHPPFVIHREHIKAPLRRLGKLALRKQSKIVANYNADRAALLAIHRCLCRLNIVCGAGFDFDKAKHILVPSDQVNLSMMPGSAKIPSHHDVSAPPQIEKSIFLTATAGALVGGGLRIFAGHSADDVVEAAEQG